MFDSYVSEIERRHAIPVLSQRHILAGLASVVGGLSAPYEKASHVHERPVVNWLWATGCHPFGPFSNTSHVSQLLKDVALVCHALSLSALQLSKKSLHDVDLIVTHMELNSHHLPSPAEEHNICTC